MLSDDYISMAPLLLFDLPHTAWLVGRDQSDLTLPCIGPTIFLSG